MVSRWLWPGNKTFLEVASVVVTWWIVSFLCSASDLEWLSGMEDESITWVLSPVSVECVRHGRINVLTTWFIDRICLFFICKLCKRYIFLYHKVNLNSDNNIFLHVKFSSPKGCLLQDWFVLTQYCSIWITVKWCLIFKNTSKYTRRELDS